MWVIARSPTVLGRIVMEEPTTRRNTFGCPGRSAGRLRSSGIPTELHCFPGAKLSIGEQSGFNYGVLVEAHARITLGRRCMIASTVKMCDRSGGTATPIVLGDDVWVAHGATLLPGAVVGSGSVISAGSVVHGMIPPGCLAVGNPARAIPLELVWRVAPANRRCRTTGRPRGLWEEVDGRTDLLAVGAAMFACLTSRAVHVGRTMNEQLSAETKPAPPVRSIAPGGPKSVADVIDCALAFEREAR